MKKKGIITIISSIIKLIIIIINYNKKLKLSWKYAPWNYV